MHHPLLKTIQPLTETLEENLVEYIRNVDQQYHLVRDPAVKFLASIRERNQAELIPPPASPTPAAQSTPPAPADQPRTNVEVVEAKIKALTSPLTIHHVFLSMADSGLSKRQIATAFRKVQLRKNSPLKEVRKGSGNIPTSFEYVHDPVLR